MVVWESHVRVGHPQAYITKNRIILLIRFFFAWNLGFLAQKNYL